jgi:hypothetical protein
MNRYQAFAAWAPTNSVWSVWAKPVVFAQMLPRRIEPELDPQPEPLAPFEPPPVSDRTAVVLDLPGEQAIFIALNLAQAGYRPVPLYNSVPASLFTSAPPALDMSGVLAALQSAAPILASLRISPVAPPVFLLDARRAVGSAPLLPGTFDNRSISLPTHLP